MSWADEVAAALGEDLTTEVSETFGEVTVDVRAADWVVALTSSRDRLGLVYFDWLSAVDEQESGFQVICHLYAPDSHRRLLVRTALSAHSPRLATATTVFRGASWHERETHEMFGIDFAGHPNLKPLLLPDGFEGQPLRKDFVLAARAAKAWPGAKEPGESDGDAAPSRRKTQPPGVPDPETWGPRSATVEGST